MQTVDRRSVTEQLTNIDLRKWESGLYFWVITADEKRWNGRLVVE